MSFQIQVLRGQLFQEYRMISHVLLSQVSAIQVIYQTNFTFDELNEMIEINDIPSQSDPL